MSLSRRRYSTRLYLVAFSLALVLPLMGLGAAALFYYAAVERTRLEGQAAELAHQVSLVLDGDIQEQMALLKGLLTAPALATGDLAAFHAQAARAVQGSDSVIVLRTFDGRQLVNTQAPFGQKLPPAVPLSESETGALRQGRTRVSDVYASPISGEPRIAVALAPSPQEQPDTILAMTVPTARFHASITEGVPQSWIIGVGDRKGIYLTHSTRHAEVSGKPGWPSYLANAVGKSGTFYSEGSAGNRLLAGYHRSELTGWLVAANIPADIIQAPLRRSLLWLSAAAAAALTLSALFAFAVSRRIAGSAWALATRAQAVGEGRDTGPLAPGILEFAVIDAALTDAASAVGERAALNRRLVEALEQKEILLKEVNHRVKNSLQLVASILNLQRSRITDPQAKRQFEDAVRRVTAVAHIHQRLYRDDQLDKVALDRFLGELCQDLNQLAHEGNATVECDAESCFLPTERIIPVALVINELIANAFKHSFPDGSHGVIHLRCRREADGLAISVADDGRALPEGFDPRHGTGLGMKMITALVRQLRAELQVEPQPAGKKFTLHVPLDASPSTA